MKRIPIFVILIAALLTSSLSFAQLAPSQSDGCVVTTRPDQYAAARSEPRSTSQTVATLKQNVQLQVTDIVLRGDQPVLYEIELQNTVVTSYVVNGSGGTYRPDVAFVDASDVTPSSDCAVLIALLLPAIQK